MTCTAICPCGCEHKEHSGTYYCAGGCGTLMGFHPNCLGLCVECRPLPVYDDDNQFDFETMLAVGEDMLLNGQEPFPNIFDEELETKTPA